MTDDLKQQFERLVADPPPPSASPSESVFARVRSVRRRRTAGALTLASAAVVAVAVAASNLSDLDSRPPVTQTPSAPVTVVTGPPTSTPTSAAPTATGTTRTTQGTTTAPRTTTGSTKGSEQPATTTTKPTTRTTNTPPPVQPPARPIEVDVVLKPTVTDRTVSVKVTVSGTVVVPTIDGKDLPADTSFLNLSGGTQYYWGDGGEGGSDGMTAQCGTNRRTGRETYSIETHTYTKPGTYTLRYSVWYCNAERRVFTVTETAKVTVR
ncbi:hypothetical protein [Kribbella shirazensis]|uniref:PKD domain-containing protein n=1 Tax=Kribbella shirazensis TaxID=1105143 RepID=A0A7X6A1E6_9ACTN|nr:hypothetical protein [Kribbella shirazensis]NIK57109.1 hypothetical protein [Kribbella shirazensis]